MAFAQAATAVAVLVVGALAQSKGSDQWIKIESGGHTRKALLHLPPKQSASPNQALPLVTVLHTMAETPGLTVSLTGFSDLADKEGFAVVYPQGWSLANAEGFLPLGFGYTWNAGACCPKACAEKVDDVQFLKDLISYLKGSITELSSNHFNLDYSRLYLSGGSNGAFMTNRIGCQAPGLFAALGPGAGPIAENASHVWGSDPYTCPPLEKPLPAIYFHGTSDTLVPWKGNPLMGFPSVESYVDRMKARNGVASDPGTVTYQRGDVQCTAYGKLASNFTFCQHSKGHCWPGHQAQGACTTNIDATAEIWSFFKNYKLDEVSSTRGAIVV